MRVLGVEVLFRFLFPLSFCQLAISLLDYLPYFTYTEESCCLGSEAKSLEVNEAQHPYYPTYLYSFMYTTPRALSIQIQYIVLAGATSILEFFSGSKKVGLATLLIREFSVYIQLQHRCRALKKFSLYRDLLALIPPRDIESRAKSKKDR